MNSLTPRPRDLALRLREVSPVNTITSCLRSTLRIFVKTVTPSSFGICRSRRMIRDVLGDKAAALSDRCQRASHRLI